jgi:AAA domain-containing protein
MADDPVRIAQFWQAIEIFSPQSLPRLDPEHHTVDLQHRDRVPWEPRFDLPGAKAGYAWRHEVYGGLYELSRVRDVLVSRYGQDREEAPPPKGKSALFACTVNAGGFLVPDSMVVSACAWGAGRVSQGASPIGDIAADTEWYADSLTRQSRVRAGVRVLGAAIRGAVPDGVAGAVTAAVSGVLTPLGPIGAGLAAVASTAAKSLTDSAVGQDDEAGASQGAREPGDADDSTRESPRLDLTAITGADLHAFISWLAAQLGVTDCLQPRGVRIRSYQVEIRNHDDEGGEEFAEKGKADPFLNSFLAEDLRLVSEALRTDDAGRALARYLTPEDRIRTTRRKDVRRDPGHVLGSCRPDLVPPGRWVTATDRPLVFSQQFAVNRIMRDHGDGQPGLFAVNGPPGTGKTTMLRDVVAAIMVRRAIKLAGLPSPEHAFTGEPLTWVTPSWNHRVSRLRPELAGDEIVVASSNNAAVENVTSEIPGPGGVADEWRAAAAEVDYFTATAREVTGEGAWALMAAVLGNSGNRGAFVTNFWFGGRRKGKRTGAGLIDILRTAPQVPDWHSAVSDFRRKLAEVQSLSAERLAVSAHASQLAQSRSAREAAAAAVQETTAERVRAEGRRPALAAANDTAARRQAQANTTASAYKDTRPGLFTSRAGKRRWNDGREEHAQEVRLAAAGAGTARESLAALDREIAAARRAERTASDALGQADAIVRSAERAIKDARSRWGDRVPDGPEYGETERQELIEKRELSAPWADEEFSRARTRLFLAALALHKAFILNAGPRIFQNLNAMKDILDGKGRPRDAAAILAAWQTLFLVVPVVSTTFASVGRMFSGLGRESLGWLLVDEAGQAAPQNAAGALWRCRRAVIVGDPLQLEPVVTLPWGGQRALLEEFKVAPVWAPSRSSTQQLADRLAIAGTTLPGPAGEDVWVGAPLRVHRRCDRPMFEVSNTIAYNGLMVFGTPTDRKPFHGENAWIDVRSSVPGSNWIPAEGDMLREVLAGLRDNGGIPASQIRVISPYRVVAENSREIFRRAFPGASDDLDQWIGTVHKMQGREADAVILVLGGDPDKPGSRRFARETPNLLNVAVTRARRRLYVIGNHETWGSERYFNAFKDPATLTYYRPRSSTPRRPELPL